MRAEHNTITGPATIVENMALYGRVTGNATLCSGVRFVLHGTIAGDLVIEHGAQAIVYGTVAGRIFNDGGRLELFGMAGAVTSRASDAETIIDKDAHVERRE